MSEPWKKYAEPPAKSSGPWAKYKPVGDQIAAQRDRTWSGVAREAVQNFPSSAARVVRETVSALPKNPREVFLNPATGDTFKVITGLVEKIPGAPEVLDKMFPERQSYEEHANAVGRFFADRYGGVENIKRTIAEDPAGFMADASTLLAGPGAAATRAGATIPGRVARAVTHPARTVGAGVGKVTGKTTAELGGLTTGAGSRALELAYGAGKAGGETAKDLRRHLRSRADVDITEPVTDMRQALSNIRQERGSAYRAGMDKATVNPTKANRALPFARIDEAIRRIGDVNRYKGKSTSPSTAKVRSQLNDIVEDWRRSDPAEFHTIEGFDALKKAIGSVRQNTAPGTADRFIADDVYRAVNNELRKASKSYADTMDAYRSASNIIKEMEQTLSARPTASIDTQLRKLQSTLRNNVQTNYGYRESLMQMLKEHGAVNILEKIAGQNLSSKTPRGMSRVAANLAVGAGGAGLLTGGIPVAPFAAYLASTSPRLAGEIAHGAGRVARNLPPPGLLRAAGGAVYQTERMEELMREADEATRSQEVSLLRPR